MEDVAPTTPLGATGRMQRRHGSVNGEGSSSRHAGSAGDHSGGGGTRHGAGTDTVHNVEAHEGEGGAAAPRCDGRGGRRQHGGVDEQRQHDGHGLSDVASAASTGDAAEGSVGRAMAERTPTQSCVHANARGGRRSREMAGLSTDLSDAAAAATPTRRGGSRTTAQDRHGSGPAEAAEAAAEAGRAREDAAARRRVERGSRVRIALVEAGTAVLKRGIAIGARVAEMMGWGGDDGRTSRGRRVRRGDG